MHWSYAQLMACPADYIPVILDQLTKAQGQ
jgi:hypothetical protein